MDGSLNSVSPSLGLTSLPLVLIAAQGQGIPALLHTKCVTTVLSPRRVCVEVKNCGTLRAPLVWCLHVPHIR